MAGGSIPSPPTRAQETLLCIVFTIAADIAPHPGLNGALSLRV